MLGAVAALASAGKAGGQDAAPLAVATVRFYSPASATTTIEGVCELRPGELFAHRGRSGRYRFSVAVLDSAGLELQRGEWSREVPATVLATRGATMAESFRLPPMAPGRYRVVVRVQPDGGNPIEREAEVMAWAQRPAISDLLVATAVRMAASDSDAATAGEVRRGSMLLRSAPVPSLTPTDAVLYYYAELYPRGVETMTGELRAEVMSGTRTIVATPPRPVQVAAQGGVTRGQLDLTGLPEGNYVLRLRFRLGDSTVTAEARFAMAGVAALAAAAPPPSRRAAEEFFAEADEARLDSLQAPVVYLEQDQERGVYQNLTLEGKRRFLVEFWNRRDPTPETPDNTALVEFYRAVTYVNESFREGGAGQVPGWRTDRGRIYLRNGRPDEVHRRPAASPRPFEVWKFTRDRNRYYVFVDQSGFGHYVLLGTNDRQEVTQQEWERVLGPESAQEVYRILGIESTRLRDRNR